MKLVLIVLGWITLVILLAFLLAIPTYYLWNWLVPSIFGLREVTLIEAWGLNMLSGFLVRSSNSNSSSK